MRLVSGEHMREMRYRFPLRFVLYRISLPVIRLSGDGTDASMIYPSGDRPGEIVNLSTRLATLVAASSWGNVGLC
jgi:hypothetical protein